MGSAGLPEAVFFDFDGTLTLTETRNAASWKRFLASQGAAVSGELLASLIGRRAIDTIGYLRERLGLESSEDELLKAFFATVDSEVRDPLPPAPGALEAAEALCAAGVPVGIVTSARRHPVVSATQAWGAEHLFATIVSGDAVERGKPDPLPYAVACASVGVRPDRALALEDSPTGLESARGAGLYTVGVAATHEAAALSVAADEVVMSMTELWKVERLAAAFEAQRER